jgi:hypothetical protein
VKVLVRNQEYVSYAIGNGDWRSIDTTQDCEKLTVGELRAISVECEKMVLHYKARAYDNYEHIRRELRWALRVTGNSTRYLVYAEACAADYDYDVKEVSAYRATTNLIGFVLEQRVQAAERARQEAKRIMDEAKAIAKAILSGAC